MMIPGNMRNLNSGVGGDVVNGGMMPGAQAAASQVPMTRPVQPQQSAPTMPTDKQRLIASMMMNAGSGMFGGAPMRTRPVNSANPMPTGAQTPLPALMQYLMQQKMAQQPPNPMGQVPLQQQPQVGAPIPMQPQTMYT